MKYNKSEIMKNAWEMVRKFKCSMSRALKEAWAKAKIRAMKFVKFVDGMEITSPNGFTRILNRWTRYDRDRVYINGGSRKGDGYVDLNTGKAHLNGTLVYQEQIAEMILNMDFGA